MQPFAHAQARWRGRGQGGKMAPAGRGQPNSAQIIEDLAKSGQEIDLLLNNAGFSFPPPHIETFAEDEIRAQMESMYFGPLRLMRAVLPNMRKRRFGDIVNVSSGAALEG
jgi:NAD(P)-dependent dehydrogenase (short-subunit alcohol dehydrogenase family)